jgi:hypothetical protein
MSMTENEGITAKAGATKDAAKDEAQATGTQAKEGAKHLVDVGKGEAANVAAEAGHQVRQLFQQSRSELVDQSTQQQKRIAEGLRSLGEELSGMARGSEQQGVASDLANQASQRVNDVAGWLENREPGALVDELKSFARRRPGAFLAGAAVLGLVGGRLSRGLVADHQEQSESGAEHVTGGTAYGTTYGTTGAYGTTGTGVGGTTYGTTTYGTPSVGGGSSYSGGVVDPVSPGVGAGVGAGVGGIAPADPGETSPVPVAPVTTAEEFPTTHDPLAPIDPRTGVERTGAGRDADTGGGDVLR